MVWVERGPLRAIVEVRRSFGRASTMSTRYVLRAGSARLDLEFDVDWFKARANPEDPIVVVAQGRGAPVSTILPDLEAIDGVEVVRWQGDDLGAWYGRIFDLVSANLPPQGASAEDIIAHAAGGLHHLPQPVLDVAAGTAVWKKLADTRVIDRNLSPEDASPLVAVTAAVGGLLRPETEGPSAYEGRGGVMFV